METLSGWLMAVFQKRMDVLDYRFAQQNRQTEEYKRIAELRDQLCQNLSKEQFQILSEWEDYKNERTSAEREAWYLCGLSDGLGMFISMEELPPFARRS
ncbi:hypothetical protein ACL02P_00525 [Paenibacillus sp. MB22_1]|uniref:hypothetical protein n=1 Tax=Paenibacillus sp. MB22_1 TaxID=3383121 RepID=UPI00399FD3FF